MIYYIISFVAAAVIANLLSDIENPYKSKSPKLIRNAKVAFGFYFIVALCLFEYMAYIWVSTGEQLHLM